MCENIIEGLNPIKLLTNESLGEIFYNYLSKNKIEHEAMINGLTGDRISNKTLFSQTCKLAQAFRSSGLKRNDVISICSENSLHFFQPAIAAFYSGIIVAPINFLYTSREILESVSISKPKIIFCSSISLPKILEIKPKAPYIETIVLLDSTLDQVQSFEEFIDYELESFSPLKEIDISEQVATILSSSGTTGIPKGVMITHKNLQTKFAQMQDPRLFVQTSDEKVLVILPFFHSSGFTLTLGFLLNSYKIIFLPRYEEDTFLRTLERYQINSVRIPPAIAVNLVKSPQVHQGQFSSVREITCGSSTLTKEAQKKLQEKTGVSIVRQGFGLTETTKAIVLMPLLDVCFGSVGKVVPYMKAKVIDLATGGTLGPGQSGELCFKGAMVTKGYYCNEIATSNTIDDEGWLHSGDIGYYNEDEFFFIIDRLKSIIKYNSYQVSPTELEELLLSHPKIKEAGVTGIPDEVAGELPAAFVITQSNVKVTEEEIQTYIAGLVAPQKRLRGGVFFVKELPKTSLGKIMRNKLRYCK